jgi:hypothetical protein
MALHQLSEFQAGTSEALHISAMPIQYTLGFLATTITKMAKAFPEASIEVMGVEDVLISNWCSLVQSGVPAE